MKPYTVIGYYEEGAVLFADHVMARNGMHAFDVARCSTKRDEVSYVVAICGHHYEGDREDEGHILTFPGECAHTDQAIKDMPDVFGPGDDPEENDTIDPVLPETPCDDGSIAVQEAKPNVPDALLNAFDDARDALHRSREIMDGTYDTDDIQACIDELYECRTHMRKLDEGPVWSAAPASKQIGIESQLAAYHSLHDGLSDMIEGGRLKEADIPDDYQWLVKTLEECTVAYTAQYIMTNPTES